MHEAMADTCVLLDIITEDAKWYDWSSGVIADAADRGRLIINPIIYAELSVGFENIETLEDILDPDIFDCRAIPREAAFLAGKAFAAYRKRGGRKQLPLPDFLIGAHASVAALPLITRDAKRFRTYFPKLKLLCP